MNFIRKPLAWDASTGDPATLCEQLIPGSWAIEAGHNPLARHEPALLLGRDCATDAMALSLSSSTAVRLTLGPSLIDRLAQLGLPVGSLAGLALHELIINAVVHGNLCVTSGRSDGWADLMERQSAIDVSLNDPIRAASLVTIVFGWSDGCVVAVIADEGSGYDTTAPRSPGRGSGRGLKIARAVGHVDVLHGGRQTAITMECSLATPGNKT